MSGLDRSTRFELLIDLKIAKALGLTSPEAFLRRADGVTSVSWGER